MLPPSTASRRQRCIVLGVAVLLDAFLVRLVPLPVMLRLTGNAAWSTPTWLKRALPDITFSHN
jgi:RND superfamily putative drug exporter